MNTHEYETITTLEGLTHIRTRPALYAGDTTQNEYNSAPMHLVKEGVGNSIDEFLNGHATFVHVTYHADGTLIVEDDGRGIPFGHNEQHNRSNLEVAASVLNSGAKFAKSKDDSPFKVSAGLHGQGLKLIVALSELTEVISRRSGEQARALFSKGEVLEPTRIVITGKKDHGTTVKWKQDPMILPNPPKSEHIQQYLTASAYINDQLKILYTFVDAEGGKVTQDLSQPRGLFALAESIVPKSQWQTERPIHINSHDPVTDNRVETLLIFTKRETEHHTSYVNGGAILATSSPIVALRAAAAKGISDALSSTYGKLNENITTSDLRSGLLTITKILHTEPAYDSQTKEKLVNTDLNQILSNDLSNRVRSSLLDNAPLLKYLHNHVNLLVKAREAAKAARDKAMGVKSNVRDTTPKIISLKTYTPPLKENPKVNQLFLFEGDSAAGSMTPAAKEKDENGVMYKTHIGSLALQGVTLGTLERSLSEILSRSPEFATIVSVSGLNRNNPDDISGLKFKEFIIATDEDAGGQFIAGQLITFFVVHFPEVVRQGRLARIRTPLFEANAKGKPPLFIYPWEDRSAALQANGFEGKPYELKRSKGLGALSANGRMTLVRNQKLDRIVHENPEDLLPLLSLISGKGRADDRKTILFNLSLPEDAE